MLRGMVYIEVTITGPSSDLHSGTYGGAVVNPINELARLISLIHDENGRIQFPGFYDGVQPLPDEILSLWNTLDFDEKAFLGGIGLSHGHGEHGQSTLERAWSRPTCDANGIIGGYTGEGAKTVIASHARAKLSCRLVSGQDPVAILESIKKFFTKNANPDCTVEIESHGCNPAIAIPTGSHWLTSACKALEEVFDKKALLIGCGGSIPAVGSIQSILGIDSLLIGFGLDDDNIHAPNEKFELACLHNGIRSHAAILAAFAESAD
jgi:acetylornithine deacetylase/succinyl-diaminopimelate desuccinylase-like protein